MMTRILLSIFLFTSLISSIQAKNIYSKENGKWHEATTWVNGDIPTAQDTVNIDGHEVTIDANQTVSVKRINITDQTANKNSVLLVYGNLTVSQSLQITSNYVGPAADSGEILFELRDDGIVNIQDHLEVFRILGNTSDKHIRIRLYNQANLTVQKNLTVDVDNITTNGKFHLDVENGSELLISQNLNMNVDGGSETNFHVKHSATFQLIGNLNVQKDGGALLDFDFKSDVPAIINGNATLINNGNTGSMLTMDIGITSITNSQLNINGNFVVTSATSGHLTQVLVNGDNSIVQVNGHLTLSAQSASDVLVQFNDASTFKLGGDIQRPLIFGSLNMAPTTMLTYFGSNSQTIAPNNLPGSGVDEVTYGNVEFTKTSGASLNLSGPTRFDEDMKLTEGIVNSDAINTLTIGNDAKFIGGGPNSYIDGPVIKEGIATGGFTFPLGNQGIYAPLSTTEILSPASIFTVEYLNCPPPIGDVPSTMTAVSNIEHWKVNRAAGSDVVDFTLGWSDAQSSGIVDPNTIVVAFQDPATNDWIDMGNQAVIGAGNGIEGAVQSDGLNCPPPIGDVIITFGSTSSTNSILPVELIRFAAKAENTKVNLTWETATEIGFDHFEIERSLDGIRFMKINQLPGQGAVGVGKKYSVYDQIPRPSRNYYRLKMVDTDGFFTYSDLQVVSFDSSNTPVIYPNPIAGMIHLKGLNLSTDQVEIRIIDPSGSILFNRIVESDLGILNLTPAQLNIQKTGIYFMQITDGGQTHTLSLFKE